MARQRLGVALLLPAPFAEQVDALRTAVGDGALGRIPAHLTLVPPVNVRAEAIPGALDMVRTAASRLRPFSLTIGPVATFLPDNPVLYLAVTGGDVTAVHALRDAVFQPPLERTLSWPYVPHVTLADDAPPERIEAACASLEGYRAEITFERVHVLREEGRVWRPIADFAFRAPAVVGRGAGLLEVEITASERLDPMADIFLVQQWVLYDEARDGPGVRWDQSPIALTARRAGTIVGVATGWTNLRVGYLSDLIVDATARGEGVGSHLLSAFEAACRERGVLRLGLRTERDGPAHGFYRRRGWTDEAFIAQWIAGRDAVQMRKDL